MAEKVNYVNSFTIRGNVVHKERFPKMLSLTIATSNPITHQTDFPRLLVFEPELADAIDNEVAIKGRIACHGYLHTSKKYPNGTLVVTSFEREKTRMEIEFEGGKDYKNDENKVLLRGVLASPAYVPQNNKVCICSVKTYNEQSAIAFPHLVCFASQKQKAIQKKTGDEISAIAFVHTRRREVDGQNVTEQTYVAQDVK